MKAAFWFNAKEKIFITKKKEEMSCVSEKKKKKKQDAWFRGRKRSRS